MSASRDQAGNQAGKSIVLASYPGSWWVER